VTGKELLLKLLRNRRGQLGAAALSILSFFAIFADWIAADVPVYVHSQGSSYLLPAVTKPERFRDMRAEQIAASLGPNDVAVWPLLRAGPEVSTSGPPMEGASAGHPLGTDAFGRDVLARLLHGTRASLALGAVAALLALVVGLSLGAVAGALGGVWDSLIERFVEVVGVFPSVVAVALVRALERRPSLLSLVLVVAAVNAANIARLVRVLVLRSLAEEWALAAQATGASPLRIAFHHLAPHLAPALSIACVLAVGSVILTETSLSFLDLGIPSPIATWGEMLGEIRWGAGARILAPPILALGLTVGSLYLIADAIRKTFEV
jgi:ABC-type dipeptide/oligopeptide/nickel transport system permease subunit